MVSGVSREGATRNLLQPLPDFSFTMLTHPISACPVFIIAITPKLRHHHSLCQPAHGLNNTLKEIYASNEKELVGPGICSCVFHSSLEAELPYLAQVADLVA